MPRIYKRRLDARPYRNYTQGYLDEAVNSIKHQKLTLREASERYGIHRNTLWRKVNGMSNNNYGGKAVFDHEEEMSFVNHAATLLEFGFPVSMNDIRYFAKHYLDRTERIVSCFKNNLPGRDWASSFIKRYDTHLSSEHFLDYSNATSNEEIVHMFFDNLEKEMEGIPACNIWCYDETNLTDDPNCKKVVSKRGTKYPDHKYNALKACASVMMLGNSKGFLSPLYVNYQAEKLYPNWTENGPEGTRYNRTNSGWFDYETFEDWFISVCLPLLKEQSGTKLLMGDIISSPISVEVLNLCKENDIKLLALPKKSWYLLNPLNIAIFYSMKSLWQNIIEEWTGNSYLCMNATLPKDKFPVFLLRMMSEFNNIEQQIKLGFKKSGIFPLDRSQVLKRMASSELQSSSFVENNNKEPYLSQLRAWKRATLSQDSTEEKWSVEDLCNPSTSSQKECKKTKKMRDKCKSKSQISVETIRNCGDLSVDKHLTKSSAKVMDETLSTQNLVEDENDSTDGKKSKHVYQIKGTYEVNDKKFYIVKLVGHCKSQT